jgi:hypothetical protein
LDQPQKGSGGGPSACEEPGTTAAPKRAARWRCHDGRAARWQTSSS